MTKLYARMMKAACPIDAETLEATVPFLQHDTVPHAMADHGVRQVLFFVDRGEGTIFSITIYDTEDDLRDAMGEADTEFRYQSLARLGCTAVDARALDVVAGAVNPEAPEIDFSTELAP